jgi:hypothetical protein
VRESNSRVASCAFDHGAAGSYEALTFGILDDEKRSAVLDGASRVLKLGFSEDIAASFFGQFLQADERCLANCCRGSDWYP